MENDAPHYHLAILGANGGIGRQAVEQALAQGHTVTAILRNPGNLAIEHARLTKVKGDVMNPASLEKHLVQKDAVISAIGKNSFKPTSLYSQGNKNLLAAMKKVNVDRAFFISASGLEVNPTHSLPVKLATRFILQKLLKNMYADIERMEKIVKDSGINYTILRPPRLVNKPLTGQYRFSINRILPKGLSISRADVAHFMLAHIKDESIYKTTVEVAY